MIDHVDLLSVYTRAQAIEDGTLVDVSHVASSCGFKHPAAVAAFAWAELGRLGERCHEQEPQASADDHRLGYVAALFYLAAWESKRRAHDTDRVFVELGGTRFTVAIGPGDAGEPVLTVMLPDDD